MPCGNQVPRVRDNDVAHNLPWPSGLYLFEWLRQETYHYMMKHKITHEHCEHECPAQKYIPPVISVYLSLTGTGWRDAMEIEWEAWSCSISGQYYWISWMMLDLGRYRWCCVWTRYCSPPYRNLFQTLVLHVDSRNTTRFDAFIWHWTVLSRAVISNMSNKVMKREECMGIGETTGNSLMKFQRSLTGILLDILEGRYNHQL